MWDVEREKKKVFKEIEKKWKKVMLKPGKFTNVNFFCLGIK